MRVYYASKPVGCAELSLRGGKYRLSAMVSGVPEGPFRLMASRPGGETFNFGVMMPYRGAYVLEKCYGKSAIDALALCDASELFIVYPEKKRITPVCADFAALGFADGLTGLLNEYGELITINGEKLAAVNLSSPGIDGLIYLADKARIVKSGEEYFLAFQMP